MRVAFTAMKDNHKATVNVKAQGAAWPHAVFSVSKCADGIKF